MFFVLGFFADDFFNKKVGGREKKSITFNDNNKMCMLHLDFTNVSECMFKIRKEGWRDGSGVKNMSSRGFKFKY